jgi:hypothetical protein
LSVADVLRWCEACEDATVLDTFPRYYPRWTKPLVRVPGVREILTWNLVVVMRRTEGADRGAEPRADRPVPLASGERPSS